MLSSHFRVAEYKMKEINIYPIKCQWTFFDPVTNEAIEGKQNKPILFNKKSHFPQLKSINFPRDAKIDVKLFYDPIPTCGRELIGHYFIHRKAPEHEDFKIKLKIRLNPDRMIKLEGAELI
jgi:hypothetical protein